MSLGTSSIQSLKSNPTRAFLAKHPQPYYNFLTLDKIYGIAIAKLGEGCRPQCDHTMQGLTVRC